MHFKKIVCASKEIFSFLLISAQAAVLDGF